MQRAAHDLRRAGRLSVNEDHQRHVRRCRATQRDVRLVPLFILASGRDNLGALRHEQVDDGHTLIEQATPVAAQVEHQLFHAGGIAQGHQGLAHFSSRAAGELGQVDVPRAVIQHPAVGHGRYTDLGPFHLEFQQASAIGALDAEGHLAPGFPLQQIAHLIRIHVGLHGPARHAPNQIARPDAGFMGRIPAVDLHHRHGPIDGLDQGPDAAVFAGVHEAQVFDAGLRVIDCVRVQLVEHGIDGHAH